MLIQKHKSKVLTFRAQVLKYCWKHPDFPEIAFCFSSAIIPPINTDTVYSNEHILSERWNKFAKGFFPTLVKIFPTQVLSVWVFTLLKRRINWERGSGVQGGIKRAEKTKWAKMPGLFLLSREYNLKPSGSPSKNIFIYSSVMWTMLFVFILHERNAVS